MSWLNWFRQNQNNGKAENSEATTKGSAAKPKPKQATGNNGEAARGSLSSNPASAPLANQIEARKSPLAATPQTSSEQAVLAQKEKESEREVTSLASTTLKVAPVLLPNTSSGVAPAHIQAALAIPAALLPTVKTPIRVLLVDDDASLRAHIRRFLLPEANSAGKSLAEFEVAGEADNGREGLRLIGELQPDIVLFDINMPHGGVELAGEIHKQYPAQKRIVLSSNLSPTYAQMFFHLETQGYLHKACSMQELKAALFSVMGGGVWLTWALDTDPQDEAGLKRAIGAFVKVLTSEERRYLQTFLLKGGSDNQLAQQLGITVQRAADYRSRFFTALGVQQRITIILDSIYWMMALTGNHLEPVAQASSATLAELGQLVREASGRHHEQQKLNKKKS